ncbi:hypothetical protein B0H10DRAFT_2440088 [Mycena sp. CBHHK59/15]|nr:hypothetical protein B0H10DRAFT_2440088 [Mycena sp. CBHHK59/15]
MADTNTILNDIVHAHALHLNLDQHAQLLHSLQQPDGLRTLARVLVGLDVPAHIFSAFINAWSMLNLAPQPASTDLHPHPPPPPLLPRPVCTPIPAPLTPCLTPPCTPTIPHAGGPPTPPPRLTPHSATPAASSTPALLPGHAGLSYHQPASDAGYTTSDELTSDDTCSTSSGTGSEAGVKDEWAVAERVRGLVTSPTIASRPA